MAKLYDFVDAAAILFIALRRLLNFGALLVKEEIIFEEYYFDARANAKEPLAVLEARPSAIVTCALFYDTTK